MTRLLASALAASALFNSFAFAQTGGSGCGPNKKCPESLPCCSQYGECGVGAYCLGGCDPLASNTLDSCMPAPVCKSGDFHLSSLDGTEPNTKYLGDASDINWVYSGEPKAYPEEDPNSVLLTMARGTVGTLMASTHYVWYGNIKARMKTSREAGVVTAFILLSDVKDEIDFEFVGVDLETAQSNWYFQGIPDYTHGKNLSVTDTFNNYHTYEIDWTPDTLTWKVDDKELRKLSKKDTWNETANRYDYPQTPSRVQLSLWPAGLSSNAKGTVDWAGGEIQWDTADVKSVGYYYAQVTDVNIECYDPPSGAQKSGSKSYVVDKAPGYEGNIKITNDDTILGSFSASGQDPDKGKKKPDDTKDNDPEESSEVPSVPGISGQTGAGGDRGGSGGNGQDPGGDQGSDGGSGGGGGGGGGGQVGGGNVDTFHGWSQGDSSGSNSQSSNSGTTGGATNVKTERVLSGSMLAVLLAIAAVVVI